LKHEITVDAKEGAPSEKPTGLCWIDARHFDGIDLTKPISHKTKSSGPEIGAVLIKYYSSFEKYVKKSYMVFLKISSY
jgi:hypothetical protein